jgi:cytochrome b561
MRRAPRRPVTRLERLDALLTGAALLSAPVAVGLLIVTGELTGWLRGPWAPLPALRTLHALAGLALLLALSYRGVAGLLRLARPRAGPGPRPTGLRGRSAAAGALLPATLLLVLTALAYAGAEVWWSRRFGHALLPLLTPLQWSVAHALLAPYFYAILLLVSFLRGKTLLRRLLREMREP